MFVAHIIAGHIAVVGDHVLQGVRRNHPVVVQGIVVEDRRALLGLATGTFIGWWRQWGYWLSPIIRITGIIPAVAWLPVALAILPTSFTTGVFLIFISSWLPVSSMMAAGILSTPKSFFDAAKTLGADNKFLLFHMAIPHAMPSMFIGILTATPTGIPFMPSKI
ncbi:MAG: ABC transporter permease subunit [Treponema sp.]|nr:ABC transporter permease subunit [Treponema sp.]